MYTIYKYYTFNITLVPVYYILNILVQILKY